MTTEHWVAFAGYEYYPFGGAEDYLSTHPTRKEAEDAVRQAVANEDDWVNWGQVVRWVDGRPVEGYKFWYGEWETITLDRAI